MHDAYGTVVDQLAAFVGVCLEEPKLQKVRNPDAINANADQWLPQQEEVCLYFTNCRQLSAWMMLCSGSKSEAQQCHDAQVASSHIDWDIQITNTHSNLFLNGQPGRFLTDSKPAMVADMNR